MTTYRRHSSTDERIEPTAARLDEPSAGSLGWTSRASWSMAVATLLVVSATSGCRSESGDRLIGRWVGRPSQRIDETNRTNGEDSVPVEFQLDFFRQRRFSMARIVQGQTTDPRSGQYRVTRSRGTRAEVVLTSDEPKQSVTLELAFRGDHQMVVREIDGDSRLSAYLFDRVDPKSSARLSDAAIGSESADLPTANE